MLLGFVVGELRAFLQGFNIKRVCLDFLQSSGAAPITDVKTVRMSLKYHENINFYAYSLTVMAVVPSGSLWHVWNSVATYVFLCKKYSYMRI